MKKYLERIAFTATLAVIAVGGWLALESAPRTATPAVVEVAAPAASAPVSGSTSVPAASEAAAPVAPRIEIDRAALLADADARPTTVVGVAEFLQGARAQTAPVPSVAPVAAAPVAEAPVAEELATTDDEPIIVEHTVATIPDPPDVGSSERRQAFEVEAEADSDDPWLGVRRCESHNNYAINTGNGFYGAYQFTISTWDWVAGLIGRPDLVGVRPDLAAPWDQDRLAQALAFEVDGGGLQHWPVCGRYYG